MCLLWAASEKLSKHRVKQADSLSVSPKFGDYIRKISLYDISMNWMALTYHRRLLYELTNVVVSVSSRVLLCGQFSVTDFRFLQTGSKLTYPVKNNTFIIAALGWQARGSWMWIGNFRQCFRGSVDLRTQINASYFLHHPHQCSHPLLGSNEAGVDWKMFASDTPHQKVRSRPTVSHATRTRWCWKNQPAPGTVHL